MIALSRGWLRTGEIIDHFDLIILTTTLDKVCILQMSKKLYFSLFSLHHSSSLFGLEHDVSLSSQ